jgi:hypothetical protein
MTILSVTALCIGGLICLHNLYLSLLRYPIWRWKHRDGERYRPVSGIPVLGSLMVGFSLIRLHTHSWVLVVALVLIAADTAGIHWFLGTMFYDHVLRRRQFPRQSTDRHKL